MSDYAVATPTIHATLYRHQRPPLDLSPLLTSLSVTKDISQPAGTFDLNLKYVPDTTRYPQVAALVDDLLPNDYIDLHIQQSPGKKGYRMRGFVDNATLERSTDDSGSFTRYIDVNGRDYGALLQNYQVSYTQSGQDIGRLITADGLALNLGSKDGSLGDMGVRTLVKNITETILNKQHLENLRNYNPAIQYLKHTPMVPGHFGYAAPQFQAFSGSLYDLISQVQSPPWGEYFVRDEEDGPQLYYRIAPFLTYDGYYAWDCEALGNVAYVHLSSQDTITDSLTKSQNEVYTYFLTMPAGTPGADLGSSILGAGLKFNKAVGNPYWDGAAGATLAWRARRFGFRPLEQQSPWVLGNPNRKTFTPAQGNPVDPFGVATMMNLWLVHTLGHSEDLRSGTITSHGCHGARVGDYIYYDDPLLYGYYYVQGVDIEWAEGQALTETFTVTRGQPNSHMDTHVRPHPKRVQAQRHPRTAPTRGPGRRIGPS